MTTRPFIRKITDELDKFRDTVPKKGFKDGKWTRGVLTALAKAGKHFGYRVAADKSKVPGEHRDWGEWLYDVTWFDTPENDPWDTKRSWSVPMVAECEWKRVEWEVRQDFEKLLIARAALRVMIYDGRRLKPEELCKCIDLFEGTQVGDTYFLAIYEEEALIRYCEISVRPGGARLMELGQAKESE